MATHTQIDPDVQVGGQVMIAGRLYDVAYADEVGPNVRAQTEYRRNLGIQGKKGSAYMVMVTEDGRHSPLVSLRGRL
jgi:hypothetical protein